MTLSSLQPARGAFDVVARYADIQLSYADAVGAVVAQESKATTVALDNDFRVLGFTVVP